MSRFGDDLIQAMEANMREDDKTNDLIDLGAASETTLGPYFPPFTEAIVVEDHRDPD